uniref:Uncharacterized protein n=1 Tax=Cannabis sativa TaxID=3483 RepID=A0A803Q8Q8_CANSA
MGNCGSFPKTKGDEADAPVPAPELHKEDLLKIDNDNDQEKKDNSENGDGDDNQTNKPALDDEKNPQSFQASFDDEKREKDEKGADHVDVSEKKVEIEVSSEEKEEKYNVEEVKVDEEKTNNNNKAIEPASPVADVPAATIK